MAKGTCSVSECERPAHCRGWCTKHYARWYTTGSLELTHWPTVCTAAGCDLPYQAKGFCVKHYKRYTKYGSTELPKRLTGEEKFWDNIHQSAPGQCWPWAGRCDEDGYGLLCIGRWYVRAHRFSYELLVGPIPEGLVIDHLCHTADPTCSGKCPHRRCVNPAHMEPVTTTVNAERSHRLSNYNSRKICCPHGHPLSGDNLCIDTSSGARRCRVCRLERSRRYKAEARARRREV